jgi:antirestriction protein
MDYDGFGPAQLGEYESFETISRIASGIAEHGEAFAAWAAHVGSESTELLDRFEDHYRGEWDSFEAYTEDYLQETEFNRFLDHVPEDMRGYVEGNWSSGYAFAGNQGWRSASMVSASMNRMPCLTAVAR